MPSAGWPDAAIKVPPALRYLPLSGRLLTDQDPQHRKKPPQIAGARIGSEDRRTMGQSNHPRTGAEGLDCLKPVLASIDTRSSRVLNPCWERMPYRKEMSIAPMPMEYQGKPCPHFAGPNPVNLDLVSHRLTCVASCAVLGSSGICFGGGEDGIHESDGWEWRHKQQRTNLEALVHSIWLRPPRLTSRHGNQAAKAAGGSSPCDPSTTEVAPAS